MFITLSTGDFYFVWAVAHFLSNNDIARCFDYGTRYKNTRTVPSLPCFAVNVPL